MAEVSKVLKNLQEKNSLKKLEKHVGNTKQLANKITNKLVK